MDMHVLLYMKWVTNKALRYSAGNSSPCLVVAWMGGEFGGEWTVYMNGWVPLLSI